MRILLDHVRNTVCRTEGGELSFDRFYPLDDDHKFIVRNLGSSFMIEIRKGKRSVVQRAVVRHMSVTVGSNFDSSSIIRPYIIELDPAREIFPIAQLVDKVRALGIKSSSISPMFAWEVLVTCAASHSSPQMMSDGVTERFERSASRDLLPASEFEVSGASWAVSFFGTPGVPGRHLHVYLWMEAAEDPDSVLDAIRQIQVGQLAPSYV
jgi:roadblock/LC7 domain-containing protein